MTRDATVPQIAVLDSWRGLFAIAVALLHAPVAFLGSETAVVQSLYLAVDFFLVLSGFVIAMNYEDSLATGRSVARFVWRRFWRLYPLHLTTLVAFGALVAVSQRAGVGGDGPQAAASLGDFVLMAGLLHALGTTAIDVFNWPSWSISAEIWSYLVFAALVWGIGERRHLRLAAYGTIAAMGLALVFAMPADPGRTAFLSVTGLGIGRGLFGFFVGVLAWRLYQRTRGSAVWRHAGAMTALEIALLVGLVAGLMLIDNTRALVLTIVAIFPAMVITFAHQAGGLSRLLQAPGLVTLGSLSYGIYLWHLIIAKVVSGGLDRPLQTVMEAGGYSPLARTLVSHGLLLVYLAATVTAAALSYRLIERPWRNWSRRVEPAVVIGPANALDMSVTK